MEFSVNYITYLFVAVICLPMIVGLIKGVRTKSVVNALVTLVQLIETFVLTFISLAFVKEFFIDTNSLGYKATSYLIPEVMMDRFIEIPLLPYVAFGPILLLLFVLITSHYLRPLYTEFFEGIHERLNEYIRKIPRIARHFMGGVAAIPVSLIVSVLLALVLNFVVYFMPTSIISEMAYDSRVYGQVFEKTIKPAVGSSLSKDIPLVATRLFASSNDSYPVFENNLDRKDKVIEYFNGVTLTEAVKFDENIESFALEITKGLDTDRQKAYAIYDWIRNNIEYDDEKAENIVNDTSLYYSGAKVAYYKKKGICFDYASLFIAMAIANEISVSLVTGLGYNGVFWGDHAWNKVYLSEEDRWVNVDATFGIAGEYFDNRDFNANHRHEKVRQIWEVEREVTTTIAS